MALIRKIFRYIKNTIRWLWRYGIAISLFCVCYIAFIPSSTIQFEDVWDEIAFSTSPRQFDFVSWELGAIWAKADSLLFGQSEFMDETQRSDFVRDYMADLQQAQSLEAQITAIYNNPTIADPIAESDLLQIERDALRLDLQARQSIAEAIIEGQVATILVEEGFGVLGQLLPPMAMRFTGMPNLLVTSPRDEIRMENSLVVDPMSIDERVALEDTVIQDYDVSAIVVPLGGIALYPAMIQESSNLGFVIETFAHEWVHHYLYFHPLGYSYFTGDSFAGEARIINETTADLFGKEIAILVIQRYYPELPIPNLPTFEPPDPSIIVEPDPNAFNFGAEMNTTRVTVDALLAKDKVTEAENYMDARRLFFFENGFSLRRINQAFFAFYGGYQAGGGVVGAGGADPIGPAVLSIRQNSDSLHDFILLLQGVTNRDMLLELENELSVEN